MITDYNFSSATDLSTTLSPVRYFSTAEVKSASLSIFAVMSRFSCRSYSFCFLRFADSFSNSCWRAGFLTRLRALVFFSYAVFIFSISPSRASLRLASLAISLGIKCFTSSSSTTSILPFLISPVGVNSPKPEM